MLKIDFVTLGPLIIGVIKEIPEYLENIEWQPADSDWNFVVANELRNLLGIINDEVTIYINTRVPPTPNNQIIYDEADSCEEAKELAALLNQLIQTYNGVMK